MVRNPNHVLCVSLMVNLTNVCEMYVNFSACLGSASLVAAEVFSHPIHPSHNRGVTPVPQSLDVMSGGTAY